MTESNSVTLAERGCPFSCSAASSAASTCRVSREPNKAKEKNEIFFNFFCHTFLFPQSPRGPSFQPPFLASKVRLVRPRIPPIHHIAGKLMSLHGSASTCEGRRRKKASARERHRPTVSLSKTIRERAEKEHWQFGSSRRSSASLPLSAPAPPPLRRRK
jgi:hypothetical protein